MDQKTQRIICCVLSLPCWFNYYSFLHNTTRTCDICCDGNIFKGIGSTLWKVLFVIFMCYCGFGISQCVLCIVGCLHCFKAPFQNFQSAGTWTEAFHKIVFEPSCDFEGKIKDILNKMFKH